MSPSKINDLQDSANGNGSYHEQDRNNNPDLRNIFASIILARPPPLPLLQRGNTPRRPLTQEERKRRGMNAIDMALRIVNDDFLLLRESSDEDDFSLFGPQQ